MRPTVEDILQRVDREIEAQAKVVEQLESEFENGRPRNFLTAVTNLIEAKSRLDVLKEHGKVYELSSYCNRLLQELLEHDISEYESRIKQLDGYMKRLERARRRHYAAVSVAAEIVEEKPKTFVGKGKYTDLARMVCARLDLPASRVSTIRKQLSAVKIIPGAH